MTDFFCQKIQGARTYYLVPAHRTDEEELAKLPVGQPLRVKVTRMRNVNHHRLYFALLNYAFDVWEPPDAGFDKKSEVQPEKNFDRFRHDITILSGFYEAHYRVDGSVRIEPKSISFSAMDQQEFDVLYQKTIDVIIKHVLRNYTGDELKEVIDQVLEFDG
jgi:hypothetical protein